MKSTRMLVMALAATLPLTACSEEKSPAAPPPTGPAAVASVSITPQTTTLAVERATRLTAVPRDASGNPLSSRAVSWSSSAPEIASVDAGGQVSGVAEGTATITATSEGRTGSATITVVVPVASVSVTAQLDTLEAWETRQLQAVLRGENGNVLTGREVRWTSSDTTVARVDSITGVLTGVDRGTVTVTATSEGRSGTASRVVVIRYRSVTTGTQHACNLASGGIAWCWGLNGRQGRIGIDRLNDTEHSPVPVRLPGNHQFTQLATYGTTTCGLNASGQAFCWGYGAWGLLGTGSSSLAQSPTPVAVTGGHSFRQLAAGGNHICGLVTDGRVFCWGNNGSGQLGNGNRNSSATPVHAAPGMTFSQITAGAEYTCGVASNGTSWCWGYNGLGNTGDGQRISFGNTYTLTPTQVVGGHSFIQLTAGQYHTCGVTTDGRGYCWGRNGGVLGNGNSSETSTPSAVSGGHSFTRIAAGANHTCGITTSGAAYCWGANGNGQLGLVLLNGSTVPVRAAGSLALAELSAANIQTGSASFTCAIAADRLTTWCWGRNDTGQLGNGTITDAAVANTTPSVVTGQKPL